MHRLSNNSCGSLISTDWCHFEPSWTVPHVPHEWFPEWKTVHSPVALVLYSSEIVSAQKLFLMVTIEVEKLPLLARYPPCTCPTLVTWIIARNVYGCHHSIPNWSRNSFVPNNVGCYSQNRDNMPRKSNMGFFCWVVYIYRIYINDGLHFAHCLHYKLGQVSAGDMSGFKPASQWSEVAGLPRPPNWQLKVSIQVIW